MADGVGTWRDFKESVTMQEYLTLLDIRLVRLDAEAAENKRQEMKAKK